MGEIKLLDVVALTEIWRQKGCDAVRSAQLSNTGRTDVFEVEFSDDSGEAYAFAAVPPEKLMKLYFRKDEAAWSLRLKVDLRLL